MDIVTFTREWNCLATIISYAGYGLSPEVQQRHIDMTASIEKDQLDITAVAEQIKKLDQSRVFFENIQTCIDDMNRVQEQLVEAVENVQIIAKKTEVEVDNIKTIVKNTGVTVDALEKVAQHTDGAVAGVHNDVLEMKALLYTIKQQTENQGKITKVVHTVYGKVYLSADEQETVDHAEAALIEASNNSIAKKESTDLSHQALQDKVTQVIEDIENLDVKVVAVEKGSVVFGFECYSIRAILELIDYFYSSRFQRRLGEITNALENIIGKKISITSAVIDRQSIQDVITKMESKEYEKIVQFELSCTGVDGVLHALMAFEEGYAANSMNELSKAMSESIGKPVTLHTSIDMDQMRSVIQSIQDQLGYESQVSCTKGNDPLINPITTYQNMDLTQSGAKQDISEFESEDERIKNSRPSTYQQPSYRNLSFEADKDTKTSRTYKRLRSSEHGAPKSEYEETSYTQDYISRDLRTEGNIPTIIFEDEAGLTQSSARQNISDIEIEDKLVKHLKSSTYEQPMKRKLLFKADEVAGPSRSCKFLPCIEQDAPKAKYKIPNYTQDRSTEVYEHSCKRLALQPPMLSLHNQVLVYLKEINVDHQTQPHTRILHSCAVLSPNKLLKAYYFDKYLELVDTNTGSVLQQKNLNGFPCGITALPYSQAAVTFPNTDEILILSADNLSTIRSIPVESCPSGITYHQDELLYVICTQDKLQIVRVLNLQGGSLRKFELDNVDFFDIFIKVAVSKDQHSLYITDYNTKSLIRYSLIGLTTAKRVFNELLWVRWNTGLALLDDGSVLFLCGKPGSIYHVSADLKQGYELEKIATEANCISYDRENNLVYVGCKNAIHVYILRDHGQKQAENKFRYPETEEYLACLNTEETSN